MTMAEVYNLRLKYDYIALQEPKNWPLPGEIAEIGSPAREEFIARLNAIPAERFAAIADKFIPTCLTRDPPST